MPFEKLQELLSRRNQRFVCSPARGESSAGRCVVRITHEVGPGLSEAALRTLREQIGYQEGLFRLLRDFGGVRLYCDTNSDEYAFDIAPPDEWGELAAGFQVWIDELDNRERAELLPDWLEDAVVIGEPPSSGNCYLFPVRGSYRGAVFEFEHDGFEFVKLSSDIYAFVDRLCTVDEALIRNIAGHTCYSDGKTDTQWIPIAYEYGP